MRNKIFLLLIIGLALFFYSYNLGNTYWFAADMARDTLASLRILQTKNLTLIGPPLSFGQYGLREIYFGSLSYYFGALGLLLTKSNVLGPVFVNIFLMVIGIIYFHLLSKKYLKTETQSLLATFIYALSPLVVTHLRFFWNPNFILSIAPILWYYYLRTRDENSKYTFLYATVCGVLGGLLINLHYFTAPIIIAILPFLIKYAKNRKSWFFYILGLGIGSLPLIIFELKNEFYLTQSFIFNFSHANSFTQLNQLSLPEKFLNILRILPIMLGLDHEAIVTFTLFDLNRLTILMIGFILVATIIFFACQKRTALRPDTLTFIILSLFITIFFSQEELYIRYFFVSLPLLILFLCHVIPWNKITLTLSVLYIIFTSSGILFFRQHTLSKPYPLPSLENMSKAAEIIKKDSPSGAYNITENFIDDARATYLRFFLERDLEIKKPNSELGYENLQTLYVFAPNKEIIYKQNRWEFTATKNLFLEKTIFVDKNTYIFKFINKSK